MTRLVAVLLLSVVLGCATIEGSPAGLVRPLPVLAVEPALPAGTTGSAPLAPVASANEVALVEGSSQPRQPISDSPPIAASAFPLQDEEEAPEAASEWELYFRPYLWATSVSGDVTVNGTKSDIDASFGDILDDINFGIMGQFEAEKNEEWGLILDVLYLDMDQDQNLSGSGKDLNARLQVWMAEFDYYVNAYKDAVQKVQVLGGLRYYHIRVSLDFPNSSPISDTRENQDWVDPILGARYKLDFHDDWAFVARGDVGGFGIGDSSDSYQLMGLFEWVASEHWTLGGGWRHLAFDYSKGSGSSRFEADVRLSGPLFGAQYRF